MMAARSHSYTLIPHVSQQFCALHKVYAEVANIKYTIIFNYSFTILKRP